MLHHMASVTSMLPQQWRFDASTCSFVTDGAVIRVMSVRTAEAALLPDAREQVDDLYRDLFELVDRPAARAKAAVASAFEEPKDPQDVEIPSRTVLAFYDENSESPSDRIAAFTRVHCEESERVLIASLAVSFELTEDAQQQVQRAVTLATEELAQAMAQDLLEVNTKCPTTIWRGLLGASDSLKHLYERDGYSSKLTERLEMTAQLKQMSGLDDPIDTAEEGIEIRPLNLANYDLAKVYDVLKMAFGPAPPPFEAWKRHYAQQPRFAADLSFVAWRGDKPVSVSLMEYIVEGEGGGEGEVKLIMATAAGVEQDMKDEFLAKPLEFAEDYEDRKLKIRLSAKVGYVCGVATLPAYQGKKLAQTLLRHNFQAGMRVGLESIYLGTDRYNAAAVKAYTRAGMVETKATPSGTDVAKLVSASPQAMSA